VTLRLSAHEGEDSIHLTGAVGGDLDFHREGALIRCSTGAIRREFVIRPSVRALSLEELPYRGALRVLAHPQGGLRVEIHLELEEYITGVVAGELPLLRSLPAELEAQAVAARSYTLSRLSERRSSSEGVFMWDDTRDQVYAPLREPRSAAERTAQARLHAAIGATRGEVLTRAAQTFDARYHASCGGSTASLSKITGSTSVPCPGCRGGSLGPTDWGFTATPEELSSVAERLGVGDRIVILEPSATLPEGRWSEVHLIGNAGSTKTSLTKLRSLLGVDRFQSNCVERIWPHPGQPIASGLRVEGRGRGHGVGLCQDGAHELARRGWGRAQILEHYYPATSVQSWTALDLL